MVKKVKVDEIKPWTLEIQRNCNNIPSELVSDFFKKVVTMPLLDYLTTQLNERFDIADVTIYSGLVIIPSKLISMVHKMFAGGKNLDHLLNIISQIFLFIKLRCSA